ncbi:hypothetical protein HRS9139_08066 [Pyrenophora teres f. teres]|nr:hypothetical protein HRS9139_08066 [Pyrenophora teres f. teres]
MEALEFICDRRFHKSFVLPPNIDTSRSKPYRVSFSDFGDVNSDAVVLFCGALFGTRLSYSPLDQLAKTHHVRIIHPDRPGVGGSESVEPDKRIQTWLEMIPQLLAHLNVSHVSIASHSGGDIYLMNFLLTYPHLLHPVQPYICFFAPWVHPTHSRMSGLLATQLLPASLIGKFGSLVKFVNQEVVPLVGLSGTMINNISSSLTHGDRAAGPVALTMPSGSDPEDPTNSSHESSHDLALDDPQVIDELRKHIAKFMFAEGVEGFSMDTQLFLKRSVPWCSSKTAWNDFDDAVQLLSKTIMDENRLTGSNKVWIVDCFPAESDQLVGEKGKEWFKGIWTPSQSYKYRTEDVKGTDHDFLLDPKFGGSNKWLQRVSEAWKTSDPVAATPESQGQTREQLHKSTSTMAEDMQINSQRAKQLAENIATISSRIKAVSKDGKQVRLIAVSKLKPANDILALHQKPDPIHTHFGENYVQELIEKSKLLPRTIRWHMIGGLQSNKCKQLAEQIPNLWCVSSVDSEKKANELEKGRKALSEKDNSEEKLRVKVQVNTSGEKEKSGVEPSDAITLCRHIIEKCPHLQLSGLMTIGAIARSKATTPENENEDFVALRETRDKVTKELGWEEGQLELSMGMSADFEGAIRMGSDEVRVGSEIFGERPQKKDAVVKEKVAEEKS